MRTYRQITYEELIKIETYLEEGLKKAHIAIRLKRDKSTIGRIIAKSGKDHFSAKLAWSTICEKKSNANSHPRVISDELLKDFILEKIETYWTPEQIAGRWRKDKGEVICHETIYQYIYRYHPEIVKLYFARKGKKYRKNREKKGVIDEMRMIEERPENVETREDVGHWEGDTICGPKGTVERILTNVERKSGYLLAEKTPSGHAETTADITRDLFEELPDELKISMTYDQGGEFAWHKVIETETRMIVYFCHKSSPWERGSNENTNGLLRRFIPKGTDLSTISKKDLQHYVELINNRPRKRLGFLTPAEVLQQELQQSCTSK